MSDVVWGTMCKVLRVERRREPRRPPKRRLTERSGVDLRIPNKSSNFAGGIRVLWEKNCITVEWISEGLNS